MKIDIVTPTESGMITGNLQTGRRWKKILEELGHTVGFNEIQNSNFPDLLVAIHATRSHSILSEFKRRHPNRPALLCLAGTDINLDLLGERGQNAKDKAIASMELADALIGFHPKVTAAIPQQFHSKLETVIQSATEPTSDWQKTLSITSRPHNTQPAARKLLFVGNLRPVKDPLLSLKALDFLPDRSRVQLTFIGGAIDPKLETEVIRRSSQDPQFQWLGIQSQEAVRKEIFQSDLLLITSTSEGAPNVLSESIVLGTPVLSTEILGVQGLLGMDYPGYFPVGDPEALAQKIWQFESNFQFRESLNSYIKRIKPDFLYENERQRWHQVLNQYGPAKKATPPCKSNQEMGRKNPTMEESG